MYYAEACVHVHMYMELHICVLCIYEYIRRSHHVKMKTFSEVR